jgi:spore coat protein U-like protein
MINGTNTVGYQLYRDTGRTQVWGTTIGTDTVAGTGNGTSQAITVYGRVPPQTTPPAATYNDTVNVTVTY